jgi:predicted phage terminase large subunit-like protein
MEKGKNNMSAKKGNKPVFGPASPVQKIFWDDDDTDLIIFGGGAGGGKSAMARMKVLKYIDCPKFEALFVRATNPQLEQPGGLWPTSVELYRQFGAKYTSKPKKFKFPKGSTVSMLPCQDDKALENFDGGEYSLILIDEAQNHTFNQFNYLSSRNRSLSKYKSRMVLTCNPLKGSWLLGFVEWYLDQVTGVPLPERANTIRYYSIVQGNIVTADSKEELIEKYPRAIPKSYRFIPATCHDNPILLKHDPEYLGSLENLRTNERNRLLLGSWYAVDEDDGHFKRDWVEMVPDIPPGVSILNCVRAWDFACSLKTETNRDPDYSASVKMTKCSDGYYYILDVQRFRARQHDVEEKVIQTAKDDGVYDVTVVIPRDAGAAGKNYARVFRQRLTENGIPARESAVVPTKSKLARFHPFSVIAAPPPGEDKGMVRVLIDKWNEDFFNELEGFTGNLKDARRQHDDKHTCRR